MTELVLLFGATGFVGRNLADHLVRLGLPFVAISGSGAAVPGAVTSVRLDQIGDLATLPKETAAVHLAAYRYDSARFDQAQSDILVNNTALNSRVFAFCLDRGIRELRLGSSMAVYPGGLDVMDDALPIDLNAPPYPGEAFYAWSKRYAEVMAGLYATKFGVNCVTLRLSNPYGPYDSVDPNRAHVAPAFVMKALDANPVFPIRGDPGVMRDFTYVGDVVEVIGRTLGWRDRNEVFNLCTGCPATLTELAEAAMAAAGVVKPVEAGAPGAFGPARRVSTNARILAELDFDFQSLAQGMVPTVEWYRREYPR